MSLLFHRGVGAVRMIEPQLRLLEIVGGSGEGIGARRGKKPNDNARACTVMQSIYHV